MNTINWKYAIIAGILGTILFDLAGLLLTGNWWDIPGLLGEKTGRAQGKTRQETRTIVELKHRVPGVRECGLPAAIVFGAA